MNRHIGATEKVTGPTSNSPFKELAMLDTLTERLSSLFARRRSPQRRRPRPNRVQLCVEQLETRLAPASFTWTGAISNLWSNPRNWAGGPAGAVPGPGDTAAFFGGSPNCTVDNA